MRRHCAPAAGTPYAALLCAHPFAEVQRIADASLTRDPIDVDALIAKAEACVALALDGRTDEALKLAGQCVTAHPQYCDEGPESRQLANVRLNSPLYVSQTAIGSKMGQRQSEEREMYIQKIRAAPLLDAACLLVHFNTCRRNWGPPLERPARLEWAEVLPGLSQADRDHALALVQRMWKDARAVALAYFKYPEAKRSYEEESLAFEANNAGFGEEAYQLAIQDHLVDLR